MRTQAAETQHCHHVQQLISSNASLTKLDSKGDKRIIPGTTLIRKLGLDELPQLYNVIRGDMSIVGPRPCMAYEAKALKAWQRARFNVHPGLTGLWQVSGKNRTTFRRMIELDVKYTHTHHLWHDFRILAKTLPAILRYVRD